MKPRSTGRTVHSDQGFANHSGRGRTPLPTSIVPLPFETTQSTFSTPTLITDHLSTEHSHSWKTRDWMLMFGGTAFSRNTAPTFSGTFKDWRWNATPTTTKSSKPLNSSHTPEDPVGSPPKSSPMPLPPNDLPVPQYPFLFPLVAPNRLAQDLAARPALPTNHHRLHPSPAKNASPG